MWNDNDKIIEIFSKVDENQIVYPCVCPICNKQTAHIYIHKHNDRHCGIWTWCSNCKASSHLSGKTPLWWENPDFVDPAKLCAEPEYLDQMKDKIDEWVNAIVPKDNAKANKPFIMENRFNVILKEELQGIPAGTKGVIVIKDDFKKQTIVFIDAEGKKTNINSHPEDLLNLFESK